MGWASKLVIGITMGTFLAGAFSFADPNSSDERWNEAFRAMKAGEYESAFRLFKPFAEQGDASSQYNVAWMYQYGKGVIENDDEAVRWYWRAAEQGHPGALNNLGTMHQTGEGVAENDILAAYIYLLAAEGGSEVASYNLAQMYERGEGVEKDSFTALRWYSTAAKMGHDEALSWLYRKAADGAPAAQSNLGLMYDNGEGVPEDDTEAVRWYRRAAEQGNATAQGLLGFMYANGHGVPENDAEAVRWYRRAAEQGDAGAQVNLGFMYGTGEGIPQNYAEAYFWCILSAAQGNEQASENADIVRQYLSRDQINAVQQRAAAWTATPDDGTGRATRGRNLFADADAPKPDDGTERATRQGSTGTGASAPSSPRPAPDDQVLVLQDGLQMLGYYDGALDGLYGPQTRQAIEAFQRDYELEATGQVTPDLLFMIGAIGGAMVAGEVEEEDSAPAEFTGATGSGFFVSAEGHVVTNAHVVTGCSAIRFGDGAPALLKVFEPSSDLALLKARGAGKVTPLAMRAGRGIRLGDDTIVAGYPLSDILTSTLNVTTGTVSALSGPGDDRRIFQTTAPVQAGNSGGPVLDSSGNLVGVIVSKLDAVHVIEATGDLPQNVNFAISRGLLQSFLDANAVDYEMAASDTPLSTADIAERARKATVQVICEAE